MKRNLFTLILSVGLHLTLAAQPNIILIVADDLGYGHFSANMGDYSIKELNPDFLERDMQINSELYDPELAMEYARFSTLNLDKLATQGVRMTDAYVAMSLCAPSRSALMTARYPQRFGSYCNSDLAEGLPRGETTLVPALKAAGYTNGLIGKWHLQSMANPVPEDKKWQHPLEQGFDYYYGFNHSTSKYIEPTHWYCGYKQLPGKDIPYTTDVITREALSFVENNAKGPFFLYLAYNAPHGPYNERPPEIYMTHFNSGIKRLDYYNGIVKAMDEGIGQLMSKLDDLNLAKNTIVIFLSDNGPGGSEFAVLPAAGAFRGMKGHLWQGGLRVPMIVRWPGKIPAGREYKGLISPMDIMPTVLTAAGAKPPVGIELDGRNFMPALNGESSEPVHERLFFAGQHSDNWAVKLGNPVPATRGNDPVGWAVREGDYMFRYWSESDGYELYNVKKDKGEKENILSPGHADRVAVIKRAYADWFANKKPANAINVDLWKKLLPKE